VKNTLTLLSAYGFLMFALCFSIDGNAQKVFADFDAQTDFKKYKTYAWLAPGDSVLNRYRHDKLYCGLITFSANAEIQSRGLKLDSLRPDVIFVFNTSVEEITKYSQSPVLSVGVGVAGPGYYAGGYAPVAGGKITATTEEDGILSYDMYDTQTGKLIWTAHADKTFKLSDDLEKIISDVTAKIFKKLPIKKSK
jgi:Domain of unknown function (DUF4136)